MERLNPIAQRQNLCDAATTLDSRAQAIIDKIDCPTLEFHAARYGAQVAAETHAENGYRYIKEFCHFPIPPSDIFMSVRIFLVGNYIGWQVYRMYLRRRRYSVDRVAGTLDKMLSHPRMSVCIPTVIKLGRSFKHSLRVERPMVSTRMTASIMRLCLFNGQCVCRFYNHGYRAITTAAPQRILTIYYTYAII